MASSNKLSYSRRLFLWLLGYSALMAGCFVVFQYHREKDFKAAELNTRLQLINTYILTELAEGQRPDEISLADFHPFEDIRVSVITDSGDVVYDNSTDAVPAASHLDREEIRLAMETGSGYTVRRHSRSTGNNYFYSATRGDGGYIVRTAVPYSLSLSALLKADYTFLWAMGLISLLICLLGYFATRRIGQHILRLKEFAENVEKGTVISDTAPFPDDELGAISNHIVSLYARLQQTSRDRDNEHRAALHQQQEKERIKKQLTNNINHELKTPVASMSLCLETLLSHENMSEEQRTMFLKRALAGTDRLQRLLSDVSLITRMDDGSASIEKEPLDLAEIIASVADDHRLPADAKGISITNLVQGPLPVTGNRALLEAVLNNLADNAIAYSGGTAITIGPVTAGNGIITLTFADNGCGVAAEHLPRLFERFYRIDKGRSRACGGTGLGLAIVRNAVAFHGGEICVANRTGGLLFTITLPTA